MNLQGTIKSVTPDGGYQGTNGYIYTYQMTIEAADGAHTGQIGSKSEHYPLGVGSAIAVEVTETPHGVRFKKFNPQYAPPSPRQATPPPPPQTPPINRDECIMRQCAGKCASAIATRPDYDLRDRFQEAQRWLCFFKDGKDPQVNANFGGDPDLQDFPEEP